MARSTWGGYLKLTSPWEIWMKFLVLKFQIISVIDGWVISCELALSWTSLDLTDYKSALVQVMAWCRQATNHYLSQCWPRSLSPYGVTWPQWVNTLRPRQNGRRFADDTFKRILLKKWISIKISLKFVPKGPINNNPALVKIMAWHRSGYKPLSEPMMVSLLTHICVTRPQWVKARGSLFSLLSPLDVKISQQKHASMNFHFCIFSSKEYIVSYRNTNLTDNSISDLLHM